MNHSVKKYLERRFVLPTAAVVALSAAVLTSVLSVTASEAATKEATLSPQQITEQLLAQGYTQVIRMEMEDGIYEVRVKAADGTREKLNVDPTTGKVIGKHKDSFFSN